MDSIGTFEDKFRYDYLKEFYIKNVQLRSSTGVDRINRDSFENKLPIYINNICRKVLNETYKFTPYKEKLLLKDRNKVPRVISIPTIRDKITLGVLKEILHDNFQEELSHKLSQVIIDEIIDVIKKGTYDYFIKIDMSNFFGSLNQELVIKRIQERIKEPRMISLIKKAIQVPTIGGSTKDKNKNIKGVPQGLPISNIISDIYLSEFDIKNILSKNYKYFRYVDDIIIICKKDESQKIKNLVYDDLTLKYLLKINEEKSIDGEITEGFTYIGYLIKGDLISVRSSSIKKLEMGIEKIFLDFKYSNYKNIDLFIWKLNLRITGCFNENKKYGWLFYFSQINDLQLLYHLDWLVLKLFKRFITKPIGKEYKIRKFIRAHKEIIKNLHKTKYIPNFSNYSKEDKLFFLENIAHMKLSNHEESTIHAEFYKFIYNSIVDLEKDMQNFS